MSIKPRQLLVRLSNLAELKTLTTRNWWPNIGTKEEVLRKSTKIDLCSYMKTDQLFPRNNELFAFNGWKIAPKKFVIAGVDCT